MGWERMQRRVRLHPVLRGDDPFAACAEWVPIADVYLLLARCEATGTNARWIAVVGEACK
jgi:hypothetical protein